MKYVGIFAALIALGFLEAFTTVTLWSWFLVPFGVAQIGYVHAYGLGIISSYVMGARGLTGKKPVSVSLAMGFMVSVVCLVMGFVTHSFM
ncbi:hypothetical protein [Pseudomonas sp.]|uniref:hypothetical protein n=1 Tax=Pseudomonas sp. TaxID=306 RepID=UPI003FD74648